MLSIFDRDFDAFDNLFSALSQSMISSGMGETRADPVRVTHGYDGSNYVIRAVVPGFEENELHVGVNDREITISGKREQTDGKDKDWHKSSHVSFQKSVVIPTDGLIDDISADYRNGILAVTVPRKEVSRLDAKTVPIKALNPADDTEK